MHSIKPQYGFTLLEVSIVLLVIGLLLTSFMPHLSQQLERNQLRQTQEKLSLAQQAIIGFAISNGRLPCPASPSSQGQESFCSQETGSCTETLTAPSHGKCAYPFNGFLPAASLALNQANNKGYLLDSWQRPIRYSVANNNINSLNNALTRNNGFKNASITEINKKELLLLCYSPQNITSSSCGDSSNKFSAQIPLVIYSLGANAQNTTPSAAANQDNNRSFLLQNPKMNGSDNYDDLMSWISLNTLYYQLINAKVLP